MRYGWARTRVAVMVYEELSLDVLLVVVDLVSCEEGMAGLQRNPVLETCIR